MTKMTLIRDLNNFYRQMLLKKTDDFVDTAQRAELEPDEITALVVRNLLGYAAFISIKYGADEDQFVETCKIVYDEMCKGRMRAEMEH